MVPSMLLSNFLIYWPVDIVYFLFLHFFHKNYKNCTCVNFFIRMGHSMPVPLTYSSSSCSIMKLKARAGIIFIIVRNPMMGAPAAEKVIKVSFKTNNAFYSTMMASFLPVIKKNKLTEKNMRFIALFYKFT